MKRYFKALGYLLSVHVLALLVMTLFRLVEFIALHGMVVDAEASRVMAFVKGVWFDNVIACYISVLPVAVLLVAASLGWCHRRLLRGINIWYAAWFAIAFMPSAANTPYFQYFFKNINSSIFGWFGYVATTSGMPCRSLPIGSISPSISCSRGIYLCARPSAPLFRGVLPVAKGQYALGAGGKPFPYFCGDDWCLPFRHPWQNGL